MQSPTVFFLRSSPQVGFLRFLHLLTTFDWKNSPLVVNLNAELRGEPALLCFLLIPFKVCVCVCMFSSRLHFFERSPELCSLGLGVADFLLSGCLLYGLLSEARGDAKQPCLEIRSCFLPPCFQEV